MRRTIAVPDSLYETIAGHKRFTVRQSAAEHPGCPTHVLELLARDPEPAVRRAVAEHPRAAADLLHRLAADADDRVVWNVARHSNTGDQTLDLLAEHPNVFTRRRVDLPLPVVQPHARDPCGDG